MHKTFLPNLLTVGCWNLEGIYEKVNSVKVSKLEQPAFLETLKKFDVLCIQEAHIGKEEPLKKIQGYTSRTHCRKISTNHRYFGGMILFIRESISKGIKVRDDFDEGTIEATFKKSFFWSEQ